MSKIKQTLGDSQDDDRYLDDEYRVRTHNIVSSPFPISNIIKDIVADQLLALKIQQAKSKSNETKHLWAICISSKPTLRRSQGGTVQQEEASTLGWCKTYVVLPVRQATNEHQLHSDVHGRQRIRYLSFIHHPWNQEGHPTGRGRPRLSVIDFWYQQSSFIITGV